MSIISSVTYTNVLLNQNTCYTIIQDFRRWRPMNPIGYNDLKKSIQFASMGITNVAAYILFIAAITVTSQDDRYCPSSSCGDREVRVRFPFNLQEESCGCPGFRLSCNQINKTVVQIGSWGEFYVRDINYGTQEVQIYDPADCLPRKLLSLDLMGSRFRAADYQTFNFFNCSSGFSSDVIRPISCMSTGNYSIYATTTTSLDSACRVMRSVMVPTPWLVSEAEIHDDLRLQWMPPMCGECVRCRSMNRRCMEVGCFERPQRGLPKGATYVLAIGIGIPTICCIVLMAYYAFGGHRGRNHLHHHSNNDELSMTPPEPIIFMVGLDETTIQSYPKTVLGESRRLPKPDDNTCPICLSEYQPKETLRSIPACKHCFHAACIDEWLRRNVTCPICRDTPMQSPIQSPENV